MPCFFPIRGWRSREVTANRGYGFTTQLSKGYADFPMQIPCGQCRGCRLKRKREWAIRMMNESRCWPLNAFVTFTYDEDHVPWRDGTRSASDLMTLRPEDMVLFMKRLRERVAPQKIRFYQAGEYGDAFMRPHHHAILFNYWPPDGRRVRSAFGPGEIFRSEELVKIWGHGDVVHAPVTMDSCAYTAGYVMKKINGDWAEDHYCGRVPEYATMSNRPGIGRYWFDNYRSEVFPNDEIVVRGGRSIPVPRYYEKVYSADEAKDFAGYWSLRGIKLRRMLKAQEDPNSTISRMIIREESQRLREVAYQRDRSML